MATLVEGKAFACVSAECFLQVIWPGRHVMHRTALVRHRGHFIGVLIAVLIGREFKVGLSRRKLFVLLLQFVVMSWQFRYDVRTQFLLGAKPTRVYFVWAYCLLQLYSNLFANHRDTATLLLCSILTFFFTYFSLLSTEEQPTSFWFCPR